MISSTRVRTTVYPCALIEIMERKPVRLVLSPRLRPGYYGSAVLEPEVFYPRPGHAARQQHRCHHNWPCTKIVRIIYFDLVQ